MTTLGPVRSIGGGPDYLGQQGVTRQALSPSLDSDEIELVTREVLDFTPAAVGTAETKTLFTVHKGDVVLSIHAVKLVLADAATTSTISMGDGNGLTRFIPATDTETGAVDDYVQPTASNQPFIYPSNDTIDADYIIGATPGATAPTWRFVMRIIRVSIMAAYVTPSTFAAGGAQTPRAPG